MLALVASDGVRTVPAMSAEPINPWRRLRALVGWTLHWHHPDDDPDMGVTIHEDRTISLRQDLTWAERRCTVLHEVLHAERGPTLDALVGREELAIRKETARLLLPDVRRIGEALAWSACRVAEAADELGVDTGTLWDRLDHLHPAERGYLRRRLEDVA